MTEYNEIDLGKAIDENGQTTNVTMFCGIADASENVTNVREYEFRLPLFVTEPVVTATVHSEQVTVGAVPGQSGTTLEVFEIDYAPQIGFSFVKVAAATTDGLNTPLTFRCSYVVVGEVERESSLQ